MSHLLDVISGSVGSDTRTKRINNMISEIDEAVSEARDKNRDKVIISVGYLCSKLNLHRSALYRNGFPDFFDLYFESIDHVQNKGLKIIVEDYVEERKDQREKLSERNGSDEDEA